MSKDIWHTPIFIPDPFKAHPIIVIYEAGDEIEQMMSNEYRNRVGDRYVNRWCYVNDLLNCEKALDVAVDALTRCQNNTPDNYTATQAVFLLAQNSVFIDKALEQITALEQKDVK